MYSDKNKFNFMVDEQNLLIPRTCENDLLQAGNSFNSIYSQSPIYSFANQSSSSADSTSPESHQDVFTLFPKLHPEQSNPPAESPLQNYNTFITRKRAIVGRKILYMADHSNSLQENDQCDLSQSNKWVDELLNSSPNRLDESNVTRIYELFPSEKSYSLQIPIQPTSTSRSSIAFNISPTFSTSSGFSNLSHSTNVPTFMERCTTPLQIASLSPPTLSPKLSSPNFPCVKSSKDGMIASPKMCTFCRKNGETAMVYMAHSLKQKVGSRSIVACPILRSHVCPSCGVSGDNAHTITYCPVLRHNNNGIRPESTTISLKSTRIKSNGKRRY